MAENGSNEGPDLALELKEQFEVEVEKAIIGLKRGEITVSQEGLEVVASQGEQYIMSVKGISVAIITKTKNSFEFKYNMKNIEKLEEQLKQNQEQFELLPQLKQIAEIAEKEKENNREDRAEDARDTLDNDDSKTEETNESQEEQQEQSEEDSTKDEKNVKMDSTALEIRPDKKIDKNNTIGKKLQQYYPELIQGDERFFIKPDENDRYNFRLYAMKKDGTVIELPINSRSEGKNAREEQVLVYNKDGSKVEQKQPLQILMISKDFGISIFGEGDRYREVTTLSRTGGDEYNGHVLCSNGATNAMDDASYDVRQSTDDTLGERNQGDAEYKIYVRLKELEEEVPEDIAPDINSDNIEAPGGEGNVLAIMEESLIKKYGLSPECAEYVSRQVIIEGKDFEGALTEGILIEEREKEDDGKIIPGSAEASAEERVKKLLNGDNNEEREEDPRLRGRR